MPKFLNSVDIEAPTLTVTDGAGGGQYQPILTLESTNSTTGNEPLILFHKNTVGNDSEDIGTIEFKGQDADGNDQVYGSIRCQSDIATGAAERGEIFLMAGSGGAAYTAIKGTAAATGGVVDVQVGTNVASVTTIAGYINIGGHSINDIDLAGEFVDSDEHLMTSAAIDDRINAAGGGVSVSDSSANTDFPIVFHDESNNLHDDSGAFTYNPSDGAITSGIWNGTVVASAYLDADTAHLSGNQTFAGNKSFADGIRYSYSKHQAASSGAGSYGVGADILYGTGGETVVAGSIYTLRSGVWTLIDADFENRCRDLVGMAVGTNSSTDGMLIKGCVTLKDVFVAGTDSAGMPVYASVTGGRATLVAPTGSGDIVRILGYSLDSSDKAMYFNPDSTYVKIA